MDPLLTREPLGTDILLLIFLLNKDVVLNVKDASKYCEYRLLKRSIVTFLYNIVDWVATEYCEKFHPAMQATGWSSYVSYEERDMKNSKDGVCTQN
jgi:hypothetical protein